MYVEYRTTAARLPQIPDRREIPEDELEAFDVALKRVAMYSEGNPVADARPRVDGQPYAQAYFSAWTQAPAVSTRLSSAGAAVVAREGLPGHVRSLDHEFSYIVLGADSGYWAMFAGHTSNAITAGVRIEAIEALVDGREEDLTAEERLQVDFIRAVRDYAMTDELWKRMVERLGTVRGAVEFAAITLIVQVTMQMMRVFGVPSLGEAEWRQLLSDFTDGTRDPGPMTQEYVWTVRERAQQNQPA